MKFSLIERQDIELQFQLLDSFIRFIVMLLLLVEIEEIFLE